MNVLRDRQFILITSLGFLSACGVNPVKSNLPLDLSHPGAIALAVDSENADLDRGVIGTQAARNLIGWNYPIALDSKAAVSHQLTAHISDTEQASTPAGFSFSMGNSDPRALDFQKADVVTISCTLNTVEKSGQSAELSMGFSDGAITGSRPDLNALSDHVSTVCFNLLREVKWPVIDSDKTGSNNHSKPNWMPEIRIETETESMPATNTPPALPVVNSGSSHKPELESQPLEKAKTVTREINKEGRKVYIIHNQGNPVIFKFGHDR